MIIVWKQLQQHKNMFQGYRQTLGCVSHSGSTQSTPKEPLVKLWLFSGLWWFRNNFMLFIPLQTLSHALRSRLRREGYSTVMLNIWTNGTLKVAKEHTGCCTCARSDLLSHFTSICPKLWSVILCGRHQYNREEISLGHCSGKQSCLRHLSNCRLCFSVFRYSGLIKVSLSLTQDFIS